MTTYDDRRLDGPTAALRLGTFASGLTFDVLPGHVVQAAKLQLLDTVGVGLAAEAMGASAAALEAVAETGEGRASVIGLLSGLPPADAAFANGVRFHALDFDDTHAESITHISAVVCASALATAEAVGAEGRQLLAASVAGKEVAIRLGIGASVALLERGFHPTSVLGVFGAAAASARLRGLDAEATANALGIAGSLAAGLFVSVRDGTDTKPLHAGFAARGGVHAAALAASGAAGPPSVFEGRFGLYDAYVGRRDVELDLDDLGTRWEVPRVAVKPYPACHFIHSSVHGAAELAREASLDPASIRRILVRVPAPAVEVVLEPAETKMAPRTPYEAKFSLQYSVAAMIVRGRLDLHSYTDGAIGDRDVLELARRVRYETRDYPSYPAAYPGGVDIHLESGEVLTKDFLHQPGSAEHPLSASAIRDKFRRNAELALTGEEVERVERAVLRLEELDYLTELMVLLRRAEAPARTLSP